MTPLDRKLRRDLSRLRGQILTISLVVGSGVASFVGLRSTVQSVERSRDGYYERQRFAHVFARLERAPDAVAGRVEALTGVAAVETRIVEEARLPLAGGADSASGRLVSLPDAGEPTLNRVYLRAGSLPEPGTEDVLVLEAFADANHLHVGDRVSVVVNGRLRELAIAGVALSPEYVYATRPGGMANDKSRFGVLWMRRRRLAAAYGHEGSWNDVSVLLQPGAHPDGVRVALDHTLEPYGGFGATDRAHQLSNRILSGELDQLQQFATTIPAIFLGVSAFLVNVVLSRLVSLQRPEIAALKALGYRNREIALHFLGVVLVTVALGTVIGFAGGAWFGRWMTNLYGGFFQFPLLDFRISAATVCSAVMVSFVAAAAGAWLAVRASVQLPPAEAMRPPPPPLYGRASSGTPPRVLGPAALMVLREVTRRPLRTLLSALGIGAAVGIVVVGRFQYDSFDFMVSDLLLRSQRQDLAVTFLRPVSRRVLSELAHAPGVVAAEAQRSVPVRLLHEGRWRDAALVGLPHPSRLHEVIDRGGRPAPLPPEGLLMTRKLGELLGLRRGEIVRIEVREGDRRTIEVPVAEFVDEAFGLQAYVPIEALARHLGQEPTVTTVLLRTAPGELSSVLAYVQRYPQVAAVDALGRTVANMRAQTGENVRVITSVVTLLAMTIAIGIIYNNARISLAQRGRDLASLRVLGFSRREISSILLGEMALQIALGLPIGLALGTTWARAIATGVSSEAMRFPLVIGARTYLQAIATAVLAGGASALWVRRRLDTLDLIEVLKTRE